MSTKVWSLKCLGDTLSLLVLQVLSRCVFCAFVFDDAKKTIVSKIEWYQWVYFNICKKSRPSIIEHFRNLDKWRGPKIPKLWKNSLQLKLWVPDGYTKKIERVNSPRPKVTIQVKVPIPSNHLIIDQITRRKKYLSTVPMEMQKQYWVSIKKMVLQAQYKEYKLQFQKNNLINNLPSITINWT